MIHRYTLKYIEYQMKKIRYLFVSDEKYRRKRFVQYFGVHPDMTSPRTFNEKIMYRMLMTPDPLFTRLADKLQARDFVRKQAGEQYLVPLFGVFRHISEIDIKVFPAQFVLKCNHDSGSVIICHDKKQFNLKETFRKLSFCMKRNMYYTTREWQYRDIKPRILCEEYITRAPAKVGGYQADIYRVHCFDGNPVWIEVEYIDQYDRRYSGIYDCNWNMLPVCMGYPNPDVLQPVPEKFHELLRVAEKLTAGIDYCRADFYLTESRIFFSEFTFSPSNGRETFTPHDWDYTFGSYWQL
ncbi:glycosyltransferase [Salmonella enterica subsp. houtenae serovar 51:z4,z23:-]|nr:glycosyltransferase [Salmonella enterica subsp. houtenae serovar 51:z4,z23:-]